MTETQNSTSLAALRQTAAAPEVRAGFDTAGGFALMQRGATLLANSTMVPEQYRLKIIKKDKFGNIKTQLDNPAGLSNCVVALNMSQRMGADPLMIMQNLYVVEGRPAWSSQFIIASINACGKYSPLRFKLDDLGEKTVEYVDAVIGEDGRPVWENNRPVKEKKRITIRDMKCTAWALENKTGEVLESPPVTIELAVKEGWYGKNGSKWQTMPEVMLRYRAASFFGKLYAPELLMGIQTAEEMYDMRQDEAGVYESTGVATISTGDIKSDMNTIEIEAESKAVETSSSKKTKAEQKAETKAKAPLTDDEGPWDGQSQPTMPKPKTDKGKSADLLSQGTEGPYTPEPATVPCPNRDGKPVDEMDCAGCKSRQGCPSWV